jgi:hypothetical protein
MGQAIGLASTTNAPEEDAQGNPDASKIKEIVKAASERLYDSQPDGKHIHLWQNGVQPVDYMDRIRDRFERRPVWRADPPVILRPRLVQGHHDRCSAR